MFLLLACINCLYTGTRVLLPLSTDHALSLQTIGRPEILIIVYSGSRSTAYLASLHCSSVHTTLLHGFRLHGFRLHSSTVQASSIISLVWKLQLWVATRSDQSSRIKVCMLLFCNCAQCLLWYRYVIILHYHAVCICNFWSLWTSLGHQMSGFTIVCIVAGCTTALFQ